MNKKKGSRHQAKTRAKTSFKIEGEAALLEFARLRPKAIVSVAATAPWQAVLASRLAGHGVEVAVQTLEQTGGGEGRVSPVRAEVKVAMESETDLLAYLESHKPRLVLALDHITDPRNLGAIVRSAAFYGVEKIIVPERRQVLLTDASVATSQGGFARCDLVCVVNLGRVLEVLKKHGFWVLGAAMDGEPLEQLAGEYDRQVLVLGSEDKGLSLGVAQKCDRLIALTGPGGSPGGLDSLNVAVAAGILLHGLSR